MNLGAHLASLPLPDALAGCSGTAAVAPASDSPANPYAPVDDYYRGTAGGAGHGLWPALSASGRRHSPRRCLQRRRASLIPQ